MKTKHTVKIEVVADLETDESRANVVAKTVKERMYNAILQMLPDLDTLGIEIRVLGGDR